MDRNDVSWHGYWPACPTPFGADGGLDTTALRELLDYYLSIGVHGILINGTTGEWFSQTAQERRTVAETAIDQVAGRVPVVVGCAAYTAREAAELGRHAFSAGAAGIEATPPPYAKTYDEETIAFYEDLSSGVDGPILVYNWPHGTAVDIGPELADRLAEVDNVVALKDSTPNAEQFYETARTVVDRVRVFGPFMSVEGFERAACRRWRRLHRRRDDLRRGRHRLLGELLARRLRPLSRPRRTGRPTLPQALAAGRLGRRLRRLPESAQGDHGDDRAAGRRAPPSQASAHRSREPGGDS